MLHSLMGNRRGEGAGKRMEAGPCTRCPPLLQGRPRCTFHCYSECSNLSKCLPPPPRARWGAELACGHTSVPHSCPAWSWGAPCSLRMRSRATVRLHGGQFTSGRRVTGLANRRCTRCTCIHAHLRLLCELQEQRKVPAGHTVGTAPGTTGRRMCHEHLRAEKTPCASYSFKSC